MIIQTDNVYKKYGRFEALQGLSIAVPEGSAFALIGANGAGKSTTIKLLMNIISPSQGSATILGVDSRKISPKELAQIGFVGADGVGGIAGAGEILEVKRDLAGKFRWGLRHGHGRRHPGTRPTLRAPVGRPARGALSCRGASHRGWPRRVAAAGRR